MNTKKDTAMRWAGLVAGGGAVGGLLEWQFGWPGFVAGLPIYVFMGVAAGELLLDDRD